MFNIYFELPTGTSLFSICCSKSQAIVSRFIRSSEMNWANLFTYDWLMLMTRETYDPVLFFCKRDNSEWWSEAFYVNSSSMGSDELSSLHNSICSHNPKWFCNWFLFHSLMYHFMWSEPSCTPEFDQWVSAQVAPGSFCHDKLPTQSMR